jgi:hypothetical protein
MRTVLKIAFALGCFAAASMMYATAGLSAAEIIGYRKVCPGNGRPCYMVPIYRQSAPAAPVVPVDVALPSEYLTIGYSTTGPSLPAEYTNAALATGEAAHTPMSEVVRVLALLPKPEIGFVDFGCGFDARWCVAAAERWGCKCTGIEIDPSRAAAARERVRNLGLDHLITIVEGDAATVPFYGDVGVVYLYPDVLARLKARLEGMRAFASYLHQPPGISVTKDGDTWLYRRQAQVALYQQSGAVWGGATYSGPVCNNPRCTMCNSIRQQLGQR